MSYKYQVYAFYTTEGKTDKDSRSASEYIISLKIATMPCKLLILLITQRRLKKDKQKAILQVLPGNDVKFLTFDFDNPGEGMRFSREDVSIIILYISSMIKKTKKILYN